MTLQELYDKAVEIANEFDLTKDLNPTCIAGVYEGKFKYSVQIWVPDMREFIKTAHFNSPQVALESFEMNIRHTIEAQCLIASPENSSEDLDLDTFIPLI